MNNERKDMPGMRAKVSRLARAQAAQKVVAPVQENGGACRVPENLRSAVGGFRVQAEPCATCIYRKDSSLDLKKLEDQVRDKYMGFKGHRICHHSKDICCRGFWNAHKDEFPAGQIAQRLNAVEFVHVDNQKEKTNGRRSRSGN